MNPLRSSPIPRGVAPLAWIGAVIVLIAALVGYWGLSHYRANTPRAIALSVLAEIDHALTASTPESAATLLSSIQLPPAVATRAANEKARWITDVLRDEVSAAGLAELRRHARFGPLLEVFPTEATRWAEAANLPASECVAFRLERAGIRAEVVLHQSPSGFRVLRCNNVSQMALNPPGL